MEMSEKRRYDRPPSYTTSTNSRGEALVICLFFLYFDHKWPILYISHFVFVFWKYDSSCLHLV